MKRMAVIPALPLTLLALAMPVAAHEERPATPASTLAASAPDGGVSICSVLVAICGIEAKSEH